MNEPEITEIVLICPVDGEAVHGRPGDTEWDCERCGQRWTMEVDLSRIERHSIM